MSFFGRKNKKPEWDAQSNTSVSTHGTRSTERSGNRLSGIFGSRRPSSTTSPVQTSPSSFGGSSMGTSYGYGGPTPTGLPPSPSFAAPPAHSYGANEYPPEKSAGGPSTFDRYVTGSASQPQENPSASPPPYTPGGDLSDSKQPVAGSSNWDPAPPVHNPHNPFDAPLIQISDSAPAPIQQMVRAGTFDSASGTHRNLQELLRMDNKTIRSAFDDVPGASCIAEVDTGFLIDDSESMAKYGYWARMKSALAICAKIIGAYDLNGYSAWMMNRIGDDGADEATGTADEGWHNLKDATTMIEIFESTTPNGSTPTDERLKHILQPYINRMVNKARYGDKFPRPLNLVVFTDGVPNSRDAVKKLIINICKYLEALGAPRRQLGIQFFHIGNPQIAEAHIRADRTLTEDEKLDRIAAAKKEYEGAKKFLKELDDCLSDLTVNLNGRTVNLRDIVDTKSADVIGADGGFDPFEIFRALAGALHKQFDDHGVVKAKAAFEL